MLLASPCPFECRTTWSPRWLDEAGLLQLADQLAQRGVRQYAVQHYRAEPGAPPDAALSQGARQTIAGWFDHFETR
jgi:pyruvate formate lyase activating enzyme